VRAEAKKERIFGQRFLGVAVAVSVMPQIETDLSAGARAVLRQKHIKKMHREVPPLVLPKPFFSVGYVCARSIDRSALARTTFEARFASFGAYSGMRGRGWTENREHRARVCRAEERLYMKACRRRSLAFIEFFVRAQHHRSTIANLQGQVATGRRYRSGDLYLGVARGAILFRGDRAELLVSIDFDRNGPGA
jgi:hypothetical protein